MRNLIKDFKESQNVEVDEPIFEAKFTSCLKSLIEDPKTLVENVPLSSVKDIFNSIGERIDKWKNYIGKEETQ